MAEIPDGFPSRLSDEALADVIEQWSEEYRTRYEKSTLPELIVAFINTASQEQLRREARAATRVVTLSLYVSGGALGVSLLSLVVALVR